MTTRITSKGSKPKFRAGQVVAECWLFNGRRKETVVEYEALTRTTVNMVRPQKSAIGVRYWRPLTKRERGSEAK